MNTCKVAVVTGASSGLGKSLCLILAKNGIKVYAVARTRTKLLELNEQFANIEAINEDLSSVIGRKNVLKAIDSEKQIDYLIHCAAVVEPLIPITLIKETDWQKTIALNVEAPLFLTQDLLPKFEASKVLFVTSEPNIHPVQGASVYCISKSAINMVYQSFKNEIPPNKALFGLVSPGLIDTPMQKKIRATDKSILPSVEVLIQLHNSGQLNQPDRSAKFLFWLLTEVEGEAFSSQCWDIYDETTRCQWDLR